MSTTEFLRSMLIMADEGFARVVGDLREHPMLRSTPGGNHALWTLGHLACLEAGVPHILFGEPDPMKHEAALYGPGSKPSDDASIYPTFDESLSRLREYRAATLRALDRVGEAGLYAPPASIPPGFEAVMGSCAAVFSLLALHQMVHNGQMTDARSLAGFEPLS